MNRYDVIKPPIIAGTQEDLGYEDNGNKGILDTIYQQTLLCTEMFIHFNKYLKIFALGRR